MLKHGHFEEIAVSTIGDWGATCRDTPEDDFCRQHPVGFFLHSVKHGPLVEVDVSAGATLDRAVLRDSGPVPVAVTRESMFHVFPLGADTGAISIGSADNSDVVVNDESISAHHASLMFKDGQLHLADANSTLGTQMDGHTLSPGEFKLLRPGAKVTLGSVELMFLPADRFRLFVEQLLN
jgi:hypothetical protein